VHDQHGRTSKVIIRIHQWDGMVAWAANGAQGNSQTLCITAEVSWDLGFEGAVEPAPDASLDRLFRDGGGQFFFSCLASCMLGPGTVH
jgi:hypothetical protein